MELHDNNCGTIVNINYICIYVHFLVNMDAVRKVCKVCNYKLYCLLFSSCFLCKLLCNRLNHGVISPVIDAFTLSSLYIREPLLRHCLPLALHLGTHGRAEGYDFSVSVLQTGAWLALLPERRNTIQVWLSANLILFTIVVKCEIYTSFFFFLLKAACSQWSCFSTGSNGDATVCVGDAHKE